MENTQENVNGGGEKQEMHPIQYLLMKMEMLESYISQTNTYVAELSKVNNNGWESFEDWSKRLAQEVKVNKNQENMDLSVKRKSGIII